MIKITELHERKRRGEFRTKKKDNFHVFCCASCHSFYASDCSLRELDLQQEGCTLCDYAYSWKSDYLYAYDGLFPDHG